jgi:DNA-binding MarR family transcriptional regulator
MQKRSLNELHANQRRAEMLMKRIITHFQTALDEQLRPYGATIAQVRLLWAIRKAPGSSGAHLSRQCDVTPQTMQALIQRAEEAGWIARSKDSTNDRIVIATLTGRGEQLLQAADRIVREIEAKLWKRIKPAAIEQLNRTLEDCLENVHPERAR